jgi:hypothetical protein
MCRMLEGRRVTRNGPLVDVSAGNAKHTTYYVHDSAPQRTGVYAGRDINDTWFAYPSPRISYRIAYRTKTLY